MKEKRPHHVLLVNNAGKPVCKVYRFEQHDKTAAEISTQFDEDVRNSARKMALDEGSLTVYEPTRYFELELPIVERSVKVLNRFEEDEAAYERERKATDPIVRKPTCAERADDIVSSMWTSGEPDQKSKLEMLVKELKVRESKTGSGTFLFGYSLVDILIAINAKTKP